MAGSYEFEFDPAKNALLKKERGVSFEEIILLIDEGHLLDVVEHPNKARYPGQRIYVVDVGGYVHLVPFVREGNRITLKTVYPSRKATREYKERKERKHDQTARAH
ncbi:MAG: BrnT family toxin [Nitrospirae bacterium]|nr:BrnT family toxin [Nitrospirota bacterium]